MYVFKHLCKNKTQDFCKPTNDLKDLHCTIQLEQYTPVTC